MARENLYSAAEGGFTIRRNLGGKPFESVWHDFCINTPSLRAKGIRPRGAQDHPRLVLASSNEIRTRLPDGGARIPAQWLRQRLLEEVPNLSMPYRVRLRELEISENNDGVRFIDAFPEGDRTHREREQLARAIGGILGIRFKLPERDPNVTLVGANQDVLDPVVDGIAEQIRDLLPLEGLLGRAIRPEG